MRFRFIQIVALLAVLAGAYAGVARALDFDDENPEPPTGEVGATYYYKIGAHAGCLPYHFVIDSGALPPGLKLSDLDERTGLVSGVPTEGGDWSAWISLHDCAGKSAQTLFSFGVYNRTWGIKTSSLPSAVAGSPYSAKLEAGDRPVTTVSWQVTSGTLPAGLTLATNGTIAGTPTSVGASTFTVTATSSDINSVTRTDTKQFTLSVIALTATASRRAAEVGIPFRSTLAASGGKSPYAWSAAGGVPPGLAVGADGVITGVPTKAGSYTITVHLVDASGAAKDVQVPLAVRARLSITTKSLPGGAVGHKYNAKVPTRGGVAAFRWTIAGGALPRGLKLAAKTGTISGVPATAGTFRITLRVRDALGAVSTKALTLSVH
ncbi:MAG: Ig domain-containing protein [Gaiellaceae bacterium]